MLDYLTLLVGMCALVGTGSYILGTKWNWNRHILKLAKQEAAEWQHQYNTMRGRYAKLLQHWENPAVNIENGSTITESIHALIQVLPPKWKRIAEQFEPTIMKEVQANPQSEQKIREVITQFVKQKAGTPEEERLRVAV